MATKYPNEIQTFPTMQDITAEDAVAVITYQKAMQDGDTINRQSQQYLPKPRQPVMCNTFGSITTCY